VLNKGTIVAPSCRRSNWKGQNHCSYNGIQLTYLIIAPPVAWLHLWVDTFLCIIEFHCWSIRNRFPECTQLHEELNAFNRIAVNKTCIIFITTVHWIGQMIVTHFAGFAKLNAHWIGHFLQLVECCFGWCEVPDGRHCRVREILIECSSAQVVCQSILLHTRRWWP